MNGPLVVVGDVLLDIDVVGHAERLSPEAPVPVLSDTVERRRPGGAALAALLAARQHPEVVLIAPWAADEAAEVIRGLLPSNVRVVPMPWHGSTPIKTRLRAGGHALARWDTGGARGPLASLSGEGREALAAAAAVLVADYGGPSAGAETVRTALARSRRRAPLVWDPHPRGATPVAGADLVTPNQAEAARFAPEVRGTSWAAVGRQAAALTALWQAGAVVVTLGDRGALVSTGTGTPLVVPAPTVLAVDTCGAGDAFSVAAATALGRGSVISEAVRAAVSQAAQFVDAGGAAALDPAVDPDTTAVDDLAATLTRVRSAQGRVVATGGCFDLLHAGHIGTLQAARQLGDCLVVCLNSDASVRRLKGAGRPLQSEADRARVLTALRCVDAVAIFDEDTPEAVLDRIRPDVWVKGGDYTGTVLPEAATLARWGGTAVTLPYLAGRSTSELVAQSRRQ